MSWHPHKAPDGPKNFTNRDAEEAIKNADFTNCAYVMISGNEQTKSAFTLLKLGSEFDNITICVVAHTHLNIVEGAKRYNIAGHCYIPGWVNWEMKVPQYIADLICDLPVGGAFPGNRRYPHKAPF